MNYTAELEYLMKVLKKMRIPTELVSGERLDEQVPDLGLRHFLGLDAGYRYEDLALEENTVYKINDEFMCRYIGILLPQPFSADALLIGPYMSYEPTEAQLLEGLERLGMSASRLPQLKQYYSAVPVLPDESPLMMLVNAFAETLWGTGNAYKIVELSRDSTASAALDGMEKKVSREDVLMQMKVMERRYAYENEMMETVAKGLTHRAKMMMSNVSLTMFEQRMADPVRNMKNYIIICNTLLRKAAQQGGVHPFHLDRISSAFAARIELIHNMDEGRELMGEMMLSYCRLVRQHALRNYSPPVQKAVTYIEAEPAADLHLQHLARTLNVSAGYLSTLFHKETGKTVTAYVTDVRMDTAANLLRHTQLQVQTVAQHCGIGDVNYFSKVFKRHFGLTPRQFREEHLAQRMGKK
ncbi:MAG: helix-turn-helix domain-containing protein [Oscillospiraceae bacterium]|nr:helix-turn-helix domain-containing protein [Oscillospiraceae bacterium]